MKKALSFDDVLIQQNFSLIKSRKDVSVLTDLLGETLFPIISSNMDTVTGPKMARTMNSYGAQACLHRFQTIEDNVKQFEESKYKPWVSVGLGPKELDRAKALLEAGAKTLVIDVAHGANFEVVQQAKAVRHLIQDEFNLVVGNFSTRKNIEDFKYHLGNYKVDAWKVGVGNGSACSTRIVTGVGLPVFQTLLDCKGIKEPLICDGGIRNSGDFAKALAVGASACFIGRLFAGTDESPGEIRNSYGTVFNSLPKKSRDVQVKYKIYRGSASQESYDVQNKDTMVPEGESYLVPYVGPVENILKQLEGGLRSSMSYVGAFNLKEFREKVQFVKITNSGIIENTPYGKNL